MSGLPFMADTPFSVREAVCSNRYMWISGPITTVLNEHICHELAVMARVDLAARRWLSDKSSSAAVVLGNHPINVRRTSGASIILGHNEPPHEKRSRTLNENPSPK